MMNDDGENFNNNVNDNDNENNNNNNNNNNDDKNNNDNNNTAMYTAENDISCACPDGQLFIESRTALVFSDRQIDLRNITFLDR